MTLQLNYTEYQNHSIVFADAISAPYVADSTALQCLTDNPDCCSSSTGGYWYLPSGSAVRTYSFYAIYQSKSSGAVYLHRTSSSVAEGLYRCEIPTNGTHGDVEVAYVGVYVRGSGSGKS